jgi:HlyD family secretion protein
MSKRARGLVVIAVLILAALAIVWFLLPEEEAADTLTLYGNVEIREVVLGFRVAGRVTEMAFEEGDAVTAGSRMARLDSEPYEEALATAEARVEQARAQLDNLESGSRPQEIEQAEARVSEAEAASRNAETSYQRKLGLLESGASSAREVDAALAAREESEARLAAAREALALAREGFRSQDIAAARAGLATARAQVEEARTRLSDTELVAPSDGVVLTRIHEPGAVVATGTPVYAVSLEDPVYIRGYLAEPDLGRVVPGAPVWVTTDSSPERYRGQIGFISPRAEFTPRTVQTTDLRTDLVYRVRIVIPDAAGELRQGMPVTIHVPLETGGEGSAEPSPAVAEGD